MSHLRLKPGPLVGRLKNLIREEQLSGRLRNKEEALRFLTQLKEKGEMEKLKKG